MAGDYFSTPAGLPEEHALATLAIHDLLSQVQENPEPAITESAGAMPEAWKLLARDSWLELGAGDCSDIGGTVGLTRLAEEFGAALFCGPFAMTVGFVVPVLAACNSSDLAPVLRGDKVVTAILPSPQKSLPSLSWDWNGIALQVQRDGLVQGTATFANVPFGGEADLFLLLCATPSGLRVAQVPSDRAGVRVVQEPSLDPTTPTATVVFEGLRLLDADWVSELADLDMLNSAMWRYLNLLNGEALGGAAEVIARAVGYVRERRQFGVAVGSFQAVKHRLAKAVEALEVARSQTYEAAQGSPGQDGLDLVCARILAADAYVSICEAAIQVHGGFGVSWEQAIHFWYRRALQARTHPAPIAHFRRVLHDHL